MAKNIEMQVLGANGKYEQIYPVPAGHKDSHKTGGDDAITPTDIGAIPATQKGVASGVATLGTDGKVPTAQLPNMDYAPSKHASQHASGGSDPITPANIGAYNKEEINTLLQKKVDLGNDGKVPASQLPAMNYAPSTHASRHASGGADPITPASIGAAASGHTHTPSSIGAAPSYTYSTSGPSSLTTGKMYLQYE